MAQVLKRRRLVNPRRRMTPKQIKYFGTRRQKAALRRRNAGPYSFRKTKKALRKHGFPRTKSSKRFKYRVSRGSSPASRRYRGPGSGEFHRYLGLTKNQGGIVSQAEHAAAKAIRSVERAAEDAISTVTHQVNRRANVGEILTVVPALNPGRKRRKNRMAVRRRRTHNRRRARAYNPRRRRTNRRRTNVRHHRRRRRALLANPRVVVRYRNRRRRGSHRRRNPNGFGGMLRGNVGAVVGILGGATVTKVLTNFLPSALSTGWARYITTGIIATVQGQVIGRFMKNRSFGNWMTTGGLVIVGLELAGQFFPGFQLPFGLTNTGSGMGLISSSNFYVPQVNMPGSMASFVTPAGIPAPVVIPAGMHGLGQGFRPGFRTMRRIGRLR